MLVAPSRGPQGAASAATPGLAGAAEGCAVTAEDVGQRVCVGGEAWGVLRFFGTLHLEPQGGMWCGVELDTPHGLNDGRVAGVRYFRCRPNYGILAPEFKVSMP